MYAQTEEIDEITIKDSNGMEVTVTCAKQIVDILTSPDTDSGVKEMICSNLLQQQNCGPGTLESESCFQTAKEDTCNINVTRWNSESEKLLLEKFASFEKGKGVSRHKWKVVAEEVNKYGYNFSGEQCRLKIKSLKEKYERNKKKEKQSGASPPTDSDCGDVKDIFDKCPDMKPVYVIDTSSTSVCSSSNQPEKPSPELTVDSIDSPECCSSMTLPKSTSEPKAKKRHLNLSHSSTSPSCSSDDESSNVSAEAKHQRKHPKRAIDVMKEFLGDVLQKKEEAVERRHQENLKTVNALIDVLKDAIKKTVRF